MPKFSFQDCDFALDVLCWDSADILIAADGCQTLGRVASPHNPGGTVSPEASHIDPLGRWGMNRKVVDTCLHCAALVVFDRV